MKLHQRLQKRLAMAAVTATIFTTMGSPVFAADYDTHWAAAAISEWKDKGVINGYEDGSFKPKQNITRAELATIITNVFGLTETKGAKSFEDVKEGAWYADAIAKVSAAGIMYTEGNTFKPNTPATREEAAYALAKAYKLSGSTNKTFKDSADISSWSQDAIASLVSGGYIHGRPDGTFAPKDKLTRADLVTMIDKVTADLYNKAGTYTKDVEGNLVVSAPDVILKGMTIHGNLYIAQGVGNGDVTLEDVNVTGEVFVEGGGLNSIKLNGKTKIAKVTVNKPDGNVRIVTSGEATVEQVTAQSGVALEGKFEEVVVTNKVEINVLGQSTIGNIKVEKSAEGVTLKLSANTTIQHVSLDAKANITGKGKVEKLSLADNVNKSDLKLEATIKETTGGQDTADNNSSSSGGSSSSSSSSGSSSSGGSNNSGVVVSTYNITGQLKYGDQNLDEEIEVKLIPVNRVNGEEELDYERAVVVQSDEKGSFTFNKVPKNKKYVIVAEYDRWHVEQMIDSLNRNMSINMELTDGLFVEYATALSSNRFMVRTNNTGVKEVYIAEFNILPNWEIVADKYRQNIQGFLREGEVFIDGETYTAAVLKEGYMTPAVYQFVYNFGSGEEKPEVPDSGEEKPETPDSGEEVDKHQITTSVGDGYQIKVYGDLTEQKAGELVEFEVTTTDGYVVKKVTVNGEECTAINGVYSFTMPATQVNIEVQVEKQPESSNPGNSKPQIIVHNVEGCEIEVLQGSLTEPVVGDTVTFRVRTEKNYMLSTVSINNDITLNPPTNGVYSFTMPDKTVDIKVEVIRWETMDGVECNSFEEAVNTITSTSAYYYSADSSNEECDIEWSVTTGITTSSITTSSITTTDEAYRVFAVVKTKGSEPKKVGEGAFYVTITYNELKGKYILEMEAC